MSRTEWQYTKPHRRLLELSYRAERCEARGYTPYIDIQLYHQLWANCCNQVRLLQPVWASWPGWWTPFCWPSADQARHSAAQ
eukprot:4308875-Pyramimonas_sp.AAC.1